MPFINMNTKNSHIYKIYDDNIKYLYYNILFNLKEYIK